MSFQVKNIDATKLYLDEENPRFILPPNPSESDIILYLLTHEGIIELAKKINTSGGLLLGERIIACTENNRYVVLEGNRRLCAIKLLLNPNLIPDIYKSEFPVVDSRTRKNIQSISIDLVDSRKEAQASLAAKHIDGIKKWSTFSKQKFFVKSFNLGESLDIISKHSQTPVSKVKNAIIEYNLFQYALNLPEWTPEQLKGPLNPLELKPSAFLRAFSSRSKIYHVTGQELLKLSYDKHLEPITALPTTVFDKALYLILYYSYIETDKSKRFNTRKVIDDIPDILELLAPYINLEKPATPNMINVTPPTTSSTNPTIPVNGNEPTASINSNEPTASVNSNEPTASVNSNEPTASVNSNEPTASVNGTVPLRATPPQSKVILTSLYEDLQYSNITNTPENQGLLAIIQEIILFSQKKAYQKYPIAGAILTRSLIEQSLIYFFRKTGDYQRLYQGNNGRTPALEKLLDYLNKNMQRLIPNVNIQRTFSSFYSNIGTKDYFDMIIHNPHLVKANSDILTSIADSGLRSFIQFLIQ